MKQIDMMFPPDIKESFKAAVDSCVDVGKSINL